jgi:hypothetical protein
VAGQPATWQPASVLQVGVFRGPEDLPDRPDFE